jgi:hypothetical protein
MPDDRARLHQVLVRIESLAKEVAPKIKELQALKDEALALRKRLDVNPALQR